MVLISGSERKWFRRQSRFKKGDVIVELDGKKIEDNLRYRQVIYSHYDDQNNYC